MENEPQDIEKKKKLNKFKIFMEIEDIENKFITTNKSVEKFSDLYKIIDFLGIGAFGIVVSAIEVVSNNMCAIKVYLIRS